jgi:hypothetical protein
MIYGKNKDILIEYSTRSGCLSNMIIRLPAFIEEVDIAKQRRFFRLAAQNINFRDNFDSVNAIREYLDDARREYEKVLRPIKDNITNGRASSADRDNWRYFTKKLDRVNKSLTALKLELEKYAVMSVF